MEQAPNSIRICFFEGSRYDVQERRCHGYNAGSDLLNILVAEAIADDIASVTVTDKKMRHTRV